MDHMIRATAADGRVRAFAANTKDLVEKARTIHQTTPVATAALGRLLTAGCMMGLMMKGDRDILTLLIRGDGPIKGITVTADSKGRVKGFVHEPNVELPLKANGKLDVGGAIGKGYLTVTKDLGLKEPYTGQVELVNGELAEDLTYYFTASEQTPSSVGLGVLIDPDQSVRQAGGFILQLMPDTSEETIARLEKNLESITSVTAMFEEGLTPKDIVLKLLDGLDPEIKGTEGLQYRCNCSYDRMAKALISLGEKELTSLIAEGKPIELKCNFCAGSYTFSVEDLKEMLKVAKN